jgi:hypothetical protein
VIPQRPSPRRLPNIGSKRYCLRGSVAGLYRICEIAREILSGPDKVGRVIARPFERPAGQFTRTTHRHDYAGYGDAEGLTINCPLPFGQFVLEDRDFGELTTMLSNLAERTDHSRP